MGGYAPASSAVMLFLSVHTSRAAYSAPGSCCTPSKVGRLCHALCMVQISYRWELKVFWV